MLLYSLKRMLRAPIPCIVLVLISFSFTLLLGRLTSSINIQQRQLNAIYNNMKIDCVFADLKGKTDEIYISNTLIDVCLTENYKLSKYIDDPLFKRSLNYKANTMNALLIGVNSNRLNNKLKKFSDNLFTSSDNVIIVSEQSGYRINEIVNLIVGLNDSYKNFEFKVAGIYNGMDDNAIYCPWNVICKLAIQLGGQISAESGSFTLSDNRMLSEFKKVAEEYFSQVDISSNSINDHISGIALIMRDKEFQTTTSAAMRNIKMLETLIPILFSLSLGLGFLSSFILTRNRYMEFDLMRRIGVKPLVIVWITLMEEAVFAVIGVGFGIFINNEILALILISCLLSGSFISSLMVFRNSVMKTRRE